MSGIYATIICWTGGALGFLLTLLAIGGPTWLWLMSNDAESVWFYKIAAYMTVVVVVFLYIVEVLVVPNVPKPFGLLSGPGVMCGAEFTYFLPSIFVAMMYTYWITCLSERWSAYGFRSFNWIVIIKSILCFVAQPAIIVWSTNSTTVNAIYGALVGTAFGVFSSIYIIIFCMPRVQYVTLFYNQLTWKEITSVDDEEWRDGDDVNKIEAF